MKVYIYVEWMVNINRKNLSECTNEGKKIRSGDGRVGALSFELPVLILIFKWSDLIRNV